MIFLLFVNINFETATMHFFTSCPSGLFFNSYFRNPYQLTTYFIFVMACNSIAFFERIVGCERHYFSGYKPYS